MKLAIFDCDGTIADSQHLICAAMDRAFEKYDLAPPGRPGVLSVVGLSLDIAIARLLSEQDASPETVAALAESYRREFAILRTDPSHIEPLYDGAREAMTALAARDDVILGIATGKSRRGVERILEREGMASLFVSIQTADDHPSKPHPSMILTAMSETGAEPHNTLMIGDTTFDIDMARAAGVGAIGVSWGYHPERELQDAGAHAMIDTFGALEHAVDRVLSTRSEAAA